MNLFLKIFLWFLAAIALMFGVVVFLNWTAQTEPVVSRWRLSVRYQTDVYAQTTAQLFELQGGKAVEEFLNRLRDPDRISEVVVIDANGRSLLSENVSPDSYREVAAQALASDSVVIEHTDEVALSARRVTLPDGNSYVLIVRWERPRLTPFFGEAPWRYIRYTGLLLTAILLCWVLARYLSSPIGKLRQATQKLADGDLSTRVAGQVGRRRDELSALANDFDMMAERIESLVTSQQRLSRDVSHELRSPLARMNVALEIAKQKVNSETAPMLARIEAESERLNDMISRLLTLSKLESGSQDFDRRELNLRSLVEQVAADADFEANANGKAVKLNVTADCRVMASETLIRSAVENVLRNAVRYTREGTDVEVSLVNGGGRAKLTVADHGGGVPDAEMENLFRPFYRVGEARDRGSGGTGLGLAIAEQAIKLHKGTIGARNTADGLAVEIQLNCIS
ncbi:MAG: ATP-binding protein [Pyrinomonadaceae bacterium]